MRNQWSSKDKDTVFKLNIDDILRLKDLYEILNSFRVLTELNNKLEYPLMIIPPYKYQNKVVYAPQSI